MDIQRPTARHKQNGSLLGPAGLVTHGGLEPSTN